MQKNEIVKNIEKNNDNFLVTKQRSVFTESVIETDHHYRCICRAGMCDEFDCRIPVAVVWRRRHARQFERYFFFVSGYFVWPGLRGGVLRVYGFVRLYCEAVGRL